jgi:transglutaminase-like putative cysteine protease
MPASSYDLLAELALVAFSVAVIAGFSRLFLDGSFFVPIAASTISAHVLAAAVRWARGGLIVSLLVSTLGLLVSSALLFPPTTLVEGGFLNREVLEGFRTDLGLAWDQFQIVLAPTEVTAPFLLLIAIVMWLVAFLSDWAAFRLRAPVEALVPGTAVFVFSALFAADQNRLISAVLFIGAALALVLFHRLGETSTAGAFLGTDGVRRSQSSLLKTGLGILAVTLLGGAVAAQALPGYEEEPLYDISDLDEPEDPRVVLSPLVDIKSRLVNQPDIEVFTVNTPTRDYWRITSLDVFDGRIWRSRGSFEDASGPLDTDLPDGTSFDRVTQEFDITGLGGIWVPAAYEPSEIVTAPEGVGFEYEPESGTLIVDRARSTSDGLTYTLLSQVPIRDASVIRTAGEGIPDEIAERYLDLPADFSQRVVDEAEAIVAAAGATSTYEKALALQNYFRDPSLFAYDLEAVNGHSSERIEDFLFEVRVGYCEQFSGSFAAMARSLGIPSRVAVGFTPGEYNPAIDAYVVSGRHAHAWPEVWINDIGWLRFEPTPGRGGPNDEAYTGIPEAQASDAPGNSPTTLPEAATPVPGPQPGEDQRPVPPSSTTTTIPRDDLEGTGIIGGPQGIQTSTIIRWSSAALAVLALLFVPLIVGVVRARQARKRVAHDPRRRIGLAWKESKAALSLLGLRVSESDTPRELVDRLATAHPESARSLDGLASEVTDATFSPDTIESSRADRAEELSTKLAADARARTSARHWWLHHANPLNVWRDKSGVWGNLRARST